MDERERCFAFVHNGNVISYMSYVAYTLLLLSLYVCVCMCTRVCVWICVYVCT